MELLQETKPFFPGTASLIENLDRKYIYLYIYIYYNIMRSFLFIYLIKYIKCSFIFWNIITNYVYIWSYIYTGRVMILLRDGKHLIGTIRSFDQYSNIVLEDTSERFVYGKKYADMPLGLFVVRGDNLVLCGEIDTAFESSDKYLEKVEYGTPEYDELRAKAAAEQKGKSNLWDFN